MTLKDRFRASRAIRDVYRLIRQPLSIIEIEARNRLLEMQLIKGHSDYTRFVIISRGRSGTNLLRGMLNAHSQIRTVGEIFRRYGEIRWDTAITMLKLNYWDTFNDHLRRKPVHH